MSKECTCIAHLDKDKADKEWLEIFPNGVPIKAPVPAGILRHPDLDKPKVYYNADVARFTKEQRAGLIKFVSKKFKMSADEISADLDKGICPIRAEITSSISICPLHFRCMI
jgi:hypothetical protein